MKESPKLVGDSNHDRIVAGLRVRRADTGKPEVMLRRALTCESIDEIEGKRTRLMRRQVGVVLYLVAMVAVIIGVDFMFFRNRFWERLTVNIGIVLVFAAFYLRFLRRP
jgi:hypothetical protein